MSSTPADEPASGLALSRRTLLAGLGAASVGLPAIADAAAPSAAHETLSPLDTPLPSPASPADVQASYFEAMHSLQRAYARLLDVIVDEFQRDGRIHLSGAEGLLLVNIADGVRGRPTLHSLHWGNDRKGSGAQLKSLAKRGFLTWTKRGRTITYTLTATGQQAAHVATAALIRHASNVRQIGGVAVDDMTATSLTLARLESFWKDTILYRL